MERFYRFVISNGLRRGMRGNHPVWFVLGASAWLLSRSRRKRDQVVYRTVLQPGEGMIVTTRPPVSKKTGA
ncbi:MAG TPA: hypothetical protein VNV87_14360 [Acidimicrobiales bacterium]|nr:hypothetical protein [Acidimicrobiales bacterium]